MPEYTPALAAGRSRRVVSTLPEGHCDPEPLPREYLSYSNCQLDLRDFYAQYLAQTSGDFGNVRNETQWRTAKYVGVPAAVYHASIAVDNRFVPVHSGGPVWQAFPNSLRESNEYDFLTGYYKLYTLIEHLVLQVPTIHKDPLLHCALAIQPLHTVLAYIATIVRYHIPIAPTIAVVSLLLGVEKKTLGILESPVFARELTESVGRRTSVTEQRTENEEGAGKQTTMYSIGKARRRGKG